MTADYIQHKQTKLVAHGHIGAAQKLTKTPLTGFELTREEDFINGDKDMFDILAEQAHRGIVWKMKKHN